MRTILSGPCLLELDNRECLKVDCAGRFGKEVVFNYALHVFFFIVGSQICLYKEHI